MRRKSNGSSCGLDLFVGWLVGWFVRSWCSQVSISTIFPGNRGCEFRVRSLILQPFDSPRNTAPYAFSSLIRRNRKTGSEVRPKRCHRIRASKSIGSDSQSARELSQCAQPKRGPRRSLGPLQRERKHKKGTSFNCRDEFKELRLGMKIDDDSQAKKGDTETAHCLVCVCVCVLCRQEEVEPDLGSSTV